MWDPPKIGLAGGWRDVESAAARLVERLAPDYRVGRMTAGDPEGKTAGGDATNLCWQSGGRTVCLAGPGADLGLRRAALDTCDWILVLGSDALVLPHVRIGDDPMTEAPAGRCVGRVDAGDLDALVGLVLDSLRTEALSAAPLFGLVLAGGRSRRMGRDKATLQYHGRSQAEHTATLLAGSCERVLVSCRADQAVGDHVPGFEQVHDRFLDVGPTGGMLSAMTAFPEAAWLVAACDLPFLDEETLLALVRQRDPLRVATAFQSAVDGKPEPLCAIYEPRARFRLFDGVAVGKPCPRKMLMQSNPRLLALPRADALANVNSPEEHRSARTQLGVS